MNRRILVIGATGLLGSDLVPILKSCGFDVVAPSSAELDITNPVDCGRIPAEEFGKFEWAINCAAYTKVDLAETEKEKAFELNATGPSMLAKACAMSNIRLIHISTDYVFDGESTEPYTESHDTNPKSVYGESKLEGEQAVIESSPIHVVFRTSWLYGSHGPSFVKTVLRLLGSGNTVRIVNDQRGCPTSTVGLSEAIARAIEIEVPSGIYHATGQTDLSWYEFAQNIKEIAGIDVAIEPIRTENYPTAAKRPKNSVLSNRKLIELGIKIDPDLATPLKKVIENLTQSQDSA